MCPVWGLVLQRLKQGIPGCSRVLQLTTNRVKVRMGLGLIDVKGVLDGWGSHRGSSLWLPTKACRAASRAAVGRPKKDRWACARIVPGNCTVESLRSCLESLRLLRVGRCRTLFTGAR